MNSVSKTRNCVPETMKFVSEMMHFAEPDKTWPMLRSNDSACVSLGERVATDGSIWVHVSGVSCGRADLPAVREVPGPTTDAGHRKAGGFRAF